MIRASSTGTAGLSAANFRRRFLLVLEQLLEHGPARKRRLARQHVEDGAAQRVEIAAHVHVAGITGLLWTDIIKCTQRHAALGQPAVGLAFEPPRQPHVDQLGPPLRGQDDVRRLDVAVNHPAARRHAPGPGRSGA